MANKSVLELAVGTGSWDAGLKKAKQALDNFTQAQGGLQKALNTDSDKMQQFVRMMGQMDSTAKTAKGQLNDYKGTIETLTMQYNRMSAAQKQTIGQDYLQAIDSMKQKYQAVNEELKEMNQSLNGVKLPDTPAAGGGGLFGGGKLDGMLQVFGGNLMTKGFELATGAAMTFVNTIKDAAAQGIEMAKSGEGIRNAFERLNEPGLLDNLREATHGTVTNLELMKAAVKFNDFKLPLDQLGTMLAFAQQKAKDTGQSVDFLVESIVNGLGRKSLMILDNLGLSATEIKEKMKETGDMTTAVGEIIREQMASAGDYVETAAERATKADVDLKNAMEDLGRTLLPLQEQGVGMWNALEIGAIKLLNEGITPLVPALINLKETIGGIAESISNTSIFDGYVSALGAVADKATEMIPGLGKVYMLLKAIRGNGSNDMGAGVGAAISGAISADAGMLPDVVITPTKKTPTNTGGSGKTTTAPTYAEDSIAAQSALVSDLRKKWSEAGEAVRNDLLVQLIAAEDKLKSMNNQAALFRENQQGKLLGGDIQTSGLGSITIAEQINEASKGLQGNALESLQKLIKGGNDAQKSWTNAAHAIGSVGSALAGIDDPAAKIMGIVAEAIANIALGFAMATAKDSKLGVFGWIAAIAGGLGTMMSTISAIHSATGFAEGGVVEGNTFSGDQIPAMLNAGEVVLNRAQQGAIASQLSENGGGGGGYVPSSISGEQIFIAMNRYTRRTGKGEIVTWK